ncbi:MAG: glycerol-3-phosphate 1-O-acyltransferase PlsY [Ruminococcus sp.]|nr:glycerol-3-phosphate 1-O-acyltransferase PlsY [Ruminococcus sp.]
MIHDILLAVFPAFISAVVAYLLGSINTAIIVTKIVTKGGNIKEMGSGNAGFTNVLRCVGKVPAIVTIICDFLKAVVAVLLSVLIFYLFDLVMGLNDSYITVIMYIAGYFCILGHMFPAYFHFKGGKGVVAAIGMICVLDWRTFLIVLGLFLIIFSITKIISVGSLLGALLYGPITFAVTYFFDYKPAIGTTNEISFAYVMVISCIALLAGLTVIVKHHENINRIFHGEEKKITAKKKEN